MTAIVTLGIDGDLNGTLWGNFVNWFEPIPLILVVEIYPLQFD